MSWSPEMEIIDQLLGGDLPLSVIGHLLGTDTKAARQALYHYVRNGIVVFANKEMTLPTWQSQELLRDSTPLEQRDEIRVSLTECFSPIDERHTPTGFCRHFVRGELQGPAAYLVICQYAGEAGFYLFYCNAALNVITDTWHEDLDAAKAQAELEYNGVSKTWQYLGDGGDHGTTSLPMEGR